MQHREIIFLLDLDLFKKEIRSTCFLVIDVVDVVVDVNIIVDLRDHLVSQNC